MGDYQQTVHVDVPPDRLFGYLSDVANIPGYMPRLSQATDVGDDRVEVVAHPLLASGEQVTVTGTAWTRVTHPGRSFAWGSEGGRHGYRGEFVVEPEGSGSWLTVTLSTSRADGSAVQRGLADTLARITAIATASSD